MLRVIVDTDLLLRDVDNNPAAVALGRKGGAAKVRKGLAMATTEQRKASAVKAWATRRAKKSNIAVLRQIIDETIAAHAPANATPSKP